MALTLALSVDLSAHPTNDFATEVESNTNTARSLQARLMRLVISFKDFWQFISLDAHTVVMDGNCDHLVECINGEVDFDLSAVWAISNRIADQIKKHLFCAIWISVNSSSCRIQLVDKTDFVVGCTH